MPTSAPVPRVYRGALLLLHRSVPVGEAPVALIPVVVEALPLLRHEIKMPHKSAVNGSIVLYIQDTSRQELNRG